MKGLFSASIQSFLFLIILFHAGIDCAAGQAVSLTPQEQEWIDTHPKVRVANELDWPPFDFVDGGKPKGYTIDLVKLLARKTGLNIEFVNGYTWAELMEMFKDGRIDILPVVMETHERRSFIRFTRHYLTNPTVTVVPEKVGDITDIQDLRGRRIAIVKDYYYEDVVRKGYPDITIIRVDGFLDGLLAVLDKKADAFIGSRAVVDYTIKTHFLQGLRVAGSSGIDDPERCKLRMGVSPGNDVLYAILEKGLNAVTDEERQDLLNKWIVTESGERKKGLFTIGGTTLWLTGICLAVFAALLFLIRFLLRSTSEEAVALKFGSRQFRILIETLLVCFVILVIVLGWVAMKHNKRKIKKDVQHNLEIVLRTTADSLETWVNQRKASLQHLCSDEELVSLTKGLLNVSTEPGSIQTSGALSGLRNFFKIHEDYVPNMGFCLMNTNAINIGCAQDRCIGTTNILAMRMPHLLQRVSSGEAVFVPPMRAEVSSKYAPATAPLNVQPVIFFAAPVYNTDGTVIALLSVHVDPEKGFSQLMQYSRIGVTGESYAFNKKGYFLSKSRFTDELRAAGILKADQQLILNIEIRNPGVNMTKGFHPGVPRDELPLTRMAKDAVQGGAGVDMDGYNDYRGVPVFGAWRWMPTLGLGLATEIDVSEGLSTYYTLRLTIMSVLGITLFISIGAILFTLVLGERANKALAAARDRLEQRVEERTRELAEANVRIRESEERSRLLLESVGEGIFGVGKDGLVNFINPAGLNMLGFKINELLGQSIHAIIHHSRADGTPYPIEECPMHKSFTDGTISQVDNEVLWRKDGNSFPVEYTSVPIRKDGELAGSVVVFRDITERKKAESEIRKLSSAVTQCPVSIVITDTDGTIEYVNPRFCEVTGYSFDEAIGQNPRILKSGRMDNVLYQDMWETILSGDIWNGEIINKNKDGNMFWELVSISPIRDEHGEITHFVGCKVDITEQKRMEQELARANERMGQELNIGREIQMNMLPLIFPPFPNHTEFSIYAQLKPAREVGGDFYDFYFLDEDHFCFCIGDVSGKGVPAALFMAVTKTLIKSRAVDDFSTASILTYVNDELSHDNNACMFVTIFMGIMNIQTGELVYTNAGHNPPYVKRNAGTLESLDEIHGPVVGVVNGMTYKEERTKFDQDDILIMYTDGVTEAMDSEKNLFSDERLIALLDNLENGSPEYMVNSTVASVKKYEGTEQADDITVLALKYLREAIAAETYSEEITVKNDVAVIDDVNQMFNAFAERHVISRDISRKVNLVFDELLSNIITYAYDDDAEHEIDIRIELTEERLVITISDDGVPFNPYASAAPDTALSIEEREIGGLGIHLVRSVMDEVIYKRRIDRNVVTLVKERNKQNI
jgi:PAS domain S-box-containing protein